MPPEDDDAPESSSVAEADRQARDTSSLDEVAAGEPEGEVELEADGASADEGQDDEPTSDEPESSVEAAGEEPTSDADIDPDDPATWPEELRAVHEQYKGSPMELAKSILEQKRTFKTELDKQLAKVREERAAETKAPATPAADTPPPHLSDPEYVNTRREMNVLADRFDDDVAAVEQARKDVGDNNRRLLKIEGLLEDIDADLKVSDDAYNTSRLQEKRESLVREQHTRASEVKNLETVLEVKRDRMDRNAEKYQGLKAKARGIEGRVRTVEDTRRSEEQTFQRNTTAQEKAISTSLKQVATKLGVPEARMKRFGDNLLKSLYIQIETNGDVEDLDAFFTKEGQGFVQDWKETQAATRVAYGESKRRDVATPAPAGVAKAVNRAPMNRRDADRIAMQGARRIPIT